MPRRVTPSQLRSTLRQIQTKQRQAIQNYNNQIRQHNAEVKREVDSHNRAVRAYNTRVRANRSRLRAALQRLSQQTVTVRYTALQESVSALSTAYERLGNGQADPLLSDLAERDTANSASVLNSLLEPVDSPQFSDGELANSEITETLTSISPELSRRWGGAICALHPENPDAARHFCTSAREIITGIFDVEAPNADVLARFPDCHVTDKGSPTRRAKVIYCLDRKGIANDSLENFVDANIKDLNVLFNDLNAGAHGPAGQFSLPQLAAIKTRVEDAIEFMCGVAS